LSDIAADAAIVHGRELPHGFDVGCDVVVVGSGAGGMSAAAHLAAAGLEVLILEEGPYYRRDDYQRFTPTESLRRMFREAGMVAAIGQGQTPLISLTLGRAVGGSSLLTGAVCFRIPSDVHASWVRELGLDELGERELEAEYEDVERRIEAREVPADLVSPSTQKFVEGAARLGVAMKPMRRNTGGDCEGNARCNFGCPAGAKRSVDVAYMPLALDNGARIVSDALVEGLLTSGGRCTGVRGRLLGGRFGAPSHRFQVRARAVLVACGTIHTPQLLMAAGLRSPGIGQHITLHPGARIVARFPDRLDGWNGALQSVYSDAYHHEGIWMNGVYSSPNILAASLPGIGPELQERVRELPWLGVFGAMVHDGPGGRVMRSPGREPTLIYRMEPRDLVRLRRGMRILAEMALEAGAEEVIPPVFGIDTIRSRRDLDALEHGPLDARRIECMAFHPLGSARMANDTRRGVVDQRGRAFELDGLYLCDGSVLPTSIGVNSQVAIMTIATRIAWRLRDELLATRT
jgi:choline dehydrogenase-like flavoprotein